MSKHPEWESQILAELDARAAAYEFPVLDNDQKPLADQW